MFGNRSDGTKVTGLDGTTRLLPLFSPSRTESVIYGMLDVDTAPMDAFIEKKLAEGIKYSYTDITIAVLVRLFKKYPKVNPETGTIEIAKIVKIGITMDERYLDGLSFSHILKPGKRMFADPAILERPFP
jgi:pyruvate/2-oxoglutarate dehydrogenase complex dihydrolipoamide acyltransferase (E2) component